MIDVWNPESFDDELRTALDANAELIRNYLLTDEANDAARERRHDASPYPSNAYGAAYHALLDTLSEQIHDRVIRAWHYTRLTDPEVDALRNAGIQLSNLDSLRDRLGAQVLAGTISREIGSLLFASSPLHNLGQYRARANKFWMTSHPIETSEARDVELLLGNWGGEATYFWLEDPQLQAVVSTIGRPRVVEVAVPVDATPQAYSASKSIVASYARAIHCEPNFGAFDLCATRALEPDCILAVHTEGDETFGRLARGYPAGYIEAYA